MIEDRVVSRAVAERSQPEVLIHQVRGIEAWIRNHRQTDLRLDDALSREARLDLARRRDVVERQRQALIDWTARQLRTSDELVRSVATPRVVVVHRNDWFKSKLREGFGTGITVVADLDNGADAVGVVVAEQPDVLLVEDRLLMLPGLEVIRTVRCYAPGTVIVAQVANEEEAAPFLEAGAAKAYSRRVPPADIAAELRALLVG